MVGRITRGRQHLLNNRQLVAFEHVTIESNLRHPHSMTGQTAFSIMFT